VVPRFFCSFLISTRVETPQLGVEVGQRLVEQESGGPAHDRTPHGDALALSAGQLARLAIEQLLDFQDACGFAHALFDLVLRGFAVAQPVGHVVVDAHMRIERVVLEHHRDVALGRLDVVDDALADADLAR
jgi:hypothetical protein